MASKLLNLTPQEVVARARSVLPDSVKYHLEFPNGGQDPEKTKPFDRMVINGAMFSVCDCIGFAMWCQGISRHFTTHPTIPAFPDTPSITGGYINCTSIIQEARGFKRRTGQGNYPGGRFFSIVEKPIAGDMIVYSGWSPEFPDNPKHGHICVIVEAPSTPPNPGYELANSYVNEWISLDTRNHRAPLQIVDCSASNPQDNRAVRERDAHIWKNKNAFFVHLNREALLERIVI